MTSEATPSDNTSTSTWDAEGSPQWTGPKQAPQYSSHDPACDQCRIKKIRCGREQPKCLNCQRSNFPCCFSDRGKRRNQTKQLLSEFERVELRLSRIEEAVGNCSAAIEGLPLGPATTTPRCTCNHDDSGFSTPETSFEERNDPKRLPRRLHHIVMSETGDETYHGPWSTVALFSEVQEAIDRVTPPAIQSPGGKKRSNSEVQEEFVAYTAAASAEVMRVLTAGEEIDMSEDGQPITFPPKGLLDASIDPFFRQINSIFPIFDRTSFCLGIERLYSSSNGYTDCALPVSYNNVILQVLHSKPKPFDRSNDSGLHAESMDAELLKPFLMSSRRAFARLDQLLKLRLPNVQALLTLCLISQANFQLSMAELLLHQACDMAKRMGLHQQKYNFNMETTGAQAAERNNVFWVLFILDKNMSLMTGHSCSLPSYDCDVPLPEPSPEYPFHAQFLARIDMARIQEQIQKNLYAIEASKKGDAETKRCVIQLDSELQNWWNCNQGLLRQENIDDSKLDDMLGAELAFGYYNSRILVHRAGPKAGGGNDTLEDARACLGIMNKMNIARGSIAGSFILRRLFQCYTFTGFFEVLAQIFNSQPPVQASSDLASLQSLVNILGDICTSDQPSTYCSKLRLTVSKCNEIASRYIRYTEDCGFASTKRNSRGPSRSNTPPSGSSCLSFPLPSPGASASAGFIVSKPLTASHAPGMFSPPMSESSSRDNGSPGHTYNNDKMWFQGTSSSNVSLSDAESTEYFHDWMDGNASEHGLEEIMALL